MQNRNCLHPGSLGSSLLEASGVASRRTDQSCSRIESVGYVSVSNIVRGNRIHELLTIDVLTNHRELHIESNNVRASCIRFWMGC